jgi:Nucleotidyl transferase AbiEii toxin, Type IV TA system
VLKVPVQIADRTLPRVYVSVYDEQALVDNKLAALMDDGRTAPRDVYDLELLLARGVVPSAEGVESLGGRVTLMKRVADKLDLMSWALFRDEVLPTLPAEIHAQVDEDEYLAMKVRLLETLERSLVKIAGEVGVP